MGLGMLVFARKRDFHLTRTEEGEMHSGAGKLIDFTEMVRRFHTAVSFLHDE